VVPAGEHTISLSSAGCFPVSKTIFALPSTAWAANLYACARGIPSATAASTEDEFAYVLKLLSSFGLAEAIPESLMDAVVSVSGSSPPLLSHVQLPMHLLR